MEAGARLESLAGIGVEHSTKLHGLDSPVTQNWQRRLKLIEAKSLK